MDNNQNSNVQSFLTPQSNAPNQENNLPNQYAISPEVQPAPEPCIEVQIPKPEAQQKMPEAYVVPPYFQQPDVKTPMPQEIPPDNFNQPQPYIYNNALPMNNQFQIQPIGTSDILKQRLNCPKIWVLISIIICSLNVLFIFRYILFN